MGSKSVLGHQNDVGRGQGATREAHGGSRTAFGRARAAFRRPNGQKVDLAGSRGGATGSLRLRISKNLHESERHLH